MIDLACETRDYKYFHSEDPVEAAGFVVSDAVALLWATLQAQHGFAGLAQRAAPQLIRWESRHGWTRSGWGQVSEKGRRWPGWSRSCCQLLTCGSGFADRYLDALHRVARNVPAARNRVWQSTGRDRERRTGIWPHGTAYCWSG